MKVCSKLGIAVLAAAGVTLGSTQFAGAEEGTVEAVSSWELRGQIYPTGPSEATFVGTLSGIIYVSADDGSEDAGLITCPGTITVNTEDGSQSGAGKCVIVGSDGERVFGAFDCSGVLGEGCNGEFTLTGGTGSKEGISGGGPIRLRAAFVRLTAEPGNVVERTSAGLAVWPKLTYRLP
jgi:hypothetical protein